jgi:outer membrane protein insertion porin family
MFLLPEPTFLHKAKQAFAAGILLLACSSCSVVVPKNYPRHKPFVYEYKINLEAGMKKEEKSQLITRLDNQLDDSVRIRSVPKPFYRVLKNPPVLDTSALERSRTYMRALLNALGYFNDTIQYHTSIKTKGDQQRASVLFNVKPGKLTRLDSISYHIGHADLQRLTDSSMASSLLKKGDAFSKETIAAELDRLVQLYRDNGYRRFTREELVGVWDTLDVSLLRPVLDPFEQLQLLQRLSERRENPTANLEIILRPGYDSGRLTRYYIGDITVFPEAGRDTLNLTRKERKTGHVTVVYYRNLFRPRIFPPNIYLEKGDLYRQSNFYKTISRFNALGAWSLVNLEVDTSLRRNQDTLDFSLKMTPARKYTFTANLEGSINQSLLSGNLFGTALNTGLQNRNFLKVANRSATNVRYGIELGTDSVKSYIQTRQLSFGHTIYFPKILIFKNWVPKKYSDNARTALSVNVARTERRLLYDLTTLNASWGYETQWRNKSLSIRLPNIEYSLINRKDSLNILIANNPSLKNIFTDGFIASIMASYSIIGGTQNRVNYLRLNGELAGLLTGMIKSKFIDSQLYRFIKVDVEFARRMQYAKSSMVFRAFAGIGYEFDFTKNPNKRNNLPFFKQYFAGGPNSMRAWRLRQLGPGSTIKPFSGSSGIPDRFGDVQIELNAEYRFPIAKIWGFWFNGALFTDAGNIWFLKSAAGDPKEVFSFSRLGKDLAVGMGFGFRIDFNFFVVRLDYAYKAKNPSPAPADAAGQNKWFYNWKPLKGQLQLGINYPFVPDLFSK